MKLLPMTFWHESIYEQAIEDLGDALMDGAPFDELVALGMAQP